MFKLSELIRMINKETETLVQCSKDHFVLVQATKTSLACHKKAKDIKVGDRIKVMWDTPWVEILQIPHDDAQNIIWVIRTGNWDVQEKKKPQEEIEKESEEKRLEDLLKPSSEEFWGIC